MTYKQVDWYQCIDRDQDKIRRFTRSSLRQNSSNLATTEIDPDATQNYQQLENIEKSLKIKNIEKLLKIKISATENNSDTIKNSLMDSNSVSRNNRNIKSNNSKQSNTTNTIPIPLHLAYAVF